MQAEIDAEYFIDPSVFDFIMKCLDVRLFENKKCYSA